MSNSGNGLIEWDLKTLRIKKKLLLTGEKGICMDYHKETEKLAVGTEEGFINIFDVCDEDIQFVRVLDKQDHRVVCCKFNEAGNFLVSGSIDAVKVWNVQTGHVTHKMSTGREHKHQETVVWCVEVLKDFTIVTGDSRGRVTFWDGTLGTQVDWMQASSADILCLAVSQNQNSLFCSGVEQIVRKYVRIQTNRDGIKLDQWIRNTKRPKLHTHDVLALTTIANNQVASGGIDGFLSLSTEELKIVERIGPFLKHPFTSTAEVARMMLMTYSNYLELWKLATASENEMALQSVISDDQDNFECDGVLRPRKKSENEYYKISVFPEKLIELRSKGDEMIVCAAISNNGKLIGYSTPTAIRLFNFSIENAKPHLVRVKNAPQELVNCSQLIFTDDSSKLITIDSNGICMFFDVSSDIIECRQTIELNEHHQDLCHIVTISNCSKFLVVASLCHNVSIWCLKKGKYVHAKNLPKHVCPATAMKIRDKKPALNVAYADNRILEYNMIEFCIEFSVKLPDDLSRYAIMNLCLDPRNPNAIIFPQNNSINLIETNDEGIKTKIKKAKSKAKQFSYTHKIVKKFETVSNANEKALLLFHMICFFFSKWLIWNGWEKTNFWFLK